MQFKTIHTCIRVQNLEKSLDFYQKALNFKETRRMDYPEDKFTLVYLSDGVTDHELELTYNYDYEPYDLGTGYGHMAYEVDDLVKAHTQHVVLGVKTTEIAGLTDGAASFYFIEDPDGYSIEIVAAK